MIYALSFTAPAGHGDGRLVPETLHVCADCLYAYQTDRAVRVVKLIEAPKRVRCDALGHEGDNPEEPDVVVKKEKPHGTVDALLLHSREEWRAALKTASGQIVSALLLDMVDELAMRKSVDQVFRDHVYHAMEGVH